MKKINDAEENTIEKLKLEITGSTIHYRFYALDKDSILSEYNSSYQPIGGKLIEQLPFGIKRIATIKFTSNHSFLLTIINNGISGYEGTKRCYLKLKD